MQNKIKEFILRNIKNELSITNKKVFNEITEDLEDIYINYIKNGGEMLYAYDIYQNKIVGTIGMKIENNTLMNYSTIVCEKIGDERYE